MKAVLIAALVGAAAAHECTDIKSQHDCASAARCTWSASQSLCASKATLAAESRSKGHSSGSDDNAAGGGFDDDYGCSELSCSTCKTYCEDKGCTWISASDTCYYHSDDEATKDNWESNDSCTASVSAASLPASRGHHVLRARPATGKKESR